MGLAKGKLKETQPGAVDDDAIARAKKLAEKKRKMMEELKKTYKKKSD